MPATASCAHRTGAVEDTSKRDKFDGGNVLGRTVTPDNTGIIEPGRSDNVYYF